MTAIGFYHLTRTGVDAALPPLLSRTLAAGERALIACGDAARVTAIDDFLWSAAVPDWLPHGTAKSGHADLQPIWIGPADDLRAPPNGARFLFLLDGLGNPAEPAFARVFDLFDGNDEAAIAAARTRWSAAKAVGHAISYWRQTAKGWERAR